MNIEMNENDSFTRGRRLRYSSFGNRLYYLGLSCCKSLNSFKNTVMKVLVKYANVIFFIHNIICLHFFIVLEGRQQSVFLFWFTGLMIFTILKLRNMVSEYNIDDTNNFLDFYIGSLSNSRTQAVPAEVHNEPPPPYNPDEYIRSRFGRIQAISQRIQIMNVVLNNIRSQLQADISSDQFNPILQFYLNSMGNRPAAMPQGLQEQEINSIPLKSFCKSELLDDSNCSICLLDYEEGEEVKILSCNHLFHPNCIDRWLGNNRTCPICRTLLVSEVANTEERHLIEELDSDEN